MHSLLTKSFDRVRKLKDFLTRNKKSRDAFDGVRLRGFTRLNIVNPDGSIAGDTGWLENKVMNYACNQLSSMIAGAGGTAPIAFGALGTATNTYAAGTAAGVTTNLVGELAFAGVNSTQVGRAAVTTAVGTYTNSIGVQFTFSFTSGTNFVNSATTVTINNIGMFASSSAGTCFLNNTYATSQLTSNQQVNGTYTLVFAN